MRRQPIARFSMLVAASLAIVSIASGLSQATTVSVTKVSPGTMGTTHFPQNKQNESPMAVDPVDPMIAATGGNDEILEPDCTPATGGSSSCPFVPGVSTDGVYVTTNGGGTWSQHILDWSSFGLVSDGDPQVSFGPKPDGSGGWTFASGARLYAASLASRIGQHCLSCELDAVAFSDDNGATWSAPKVVTNKQNPVHFNDKEAVWADANPTSPHFGTVYVSWTLFTGNPLSNFGRSGAFSPEPIVVSHSTDGGTHWAAPVRLTQAANNSAVGGRQGSTMRTGPDGTLYVIWDGSMNRQSAVVGARSTDGGLTFSKAFLVSFKNDNPTLPGSSFRNDSFPAADIDASGNLYVTWTDYTNGHGVVKFAKSTNGGHSWTTSTAADVPGRSPFYPGIAVNGSNVFIGFPALDDVPAGTEPGAGVVTYDAYYVLSSDGGASFAPPVLVPGTHSDPDASSTNSLGAQFLGDYNAAAAGSDGAFWFSFTGTMQGATCNAIDMWRAGLASKPNIYDSCPTDFGNSDIFVVKVGP